MDWEKKFAARTSQLKSSVIREILKLTAQPDIISFSGGLPAPELFPVERAQQAAETVLSERGREALQYSTTEGMPELRAWIAEKFSTPHLQVELDNVLITNGSQQVLDTVGRVLLEPTDSVIVENPTYLGMSMAWKPIGVNFTAIPTDDDGMIIDELTAEIASTHKIAYSIPNFQNPMGVTLSLPRRRQLVEKMIEHDLLFFEDNPYGELRYEGEPLPHVIQLEAEVRGTSKVEGGTIYAGTFSKTLTPGLRVGWVIAAAPLIQKLATAKQATDLNTGMLVQSMSLEMVRDTAFLEAHLATLRKVYRERRDLMLSLMAQHFPAGVRWTHPQGGLFTMVTLPEGMDATELLKHAIAHKVAYVPVQDFYVGPDPVRNTFRLNFSNARPEMIETGIERIGLVLHEALASV